MQSKPRLASSLAALATQFGEELQVFKQWVRKAGTLFWELSGLNKIDARDCRYTM